MIKVIALKFSTLVLQREKEAFSSVGSAKGYAVWTKTQREAMRGSLCGGRNSEAFWVNYLKHPRARAFMFAHVKPIFSVQ